ncbi:MAG: DsrE family protein [Candidatus Didemnitutus sp.]|nr:DsrE family protein [Candidatus Didemnitutus sp.]
MKTAIVILSDPKAGEEALGRAFNGLAVAHAALQAGDTVEVVFNGAGTRWPEELVKVSHPANGLYNAVRESVRGVSCGCAAVFGATEGAQASGAKLLKDFALPGTPGISDLRRYLAEGWQTLVF